MAGDAVNSYRDLRVWQNAMEIAEECYRITRNFPKDELYGMTSQIRRASVSIAANIAEGYGRETPRAYANFLRTAQGSLKELETHLLLSQRVNILESKVFDPLLVKCDDLGRMLRSLIRKIGSISERQSK